MGVSVLPLTKILLLGDSVETGSVVTGELLFLKLKSDGAIFGEVVGSVVITSKYDGAVVGSSTITTAEGGCPP